MLEKVLLQNNNMKLLHLSYRDNKILKTKNLLFLITIHTQIFVLITTPFSHCTERGGGGGLEAGTM